MEHLQHKTFKTLTPEQVEHFMKHGWVRIKSCFSQETADTFTKDVWDRLGFDPKDKATWTSSKTNMPQHQSLPIKDLAPKAWDAICELCGGEDRLTDASKEWGDSFIVNLGSPETEGSSIPPKELDNWHVDGDFFVHFLDSPEQGLLTIPCWSAVHPNGGATWICEEGPKQIGQWLYDHPSGVTVWMQSVDELPYDCPEPPRSQRLTHYLDLIKTCPDESFHEMTGDVGDVILLHPLMLHSASKNGRRLARIITNPPIHLNEPFDFNRADPSQYSLVELKTIKELGQENLKSWKITSERRPLVPERLKIQAAMKEQEAERLNALLSSGGKLPETTSDLEGRSSGVAIAA